MQARQQQGLLSNRATLVLAASAVAILGLYGIWSLNSQEGKSVELQKGGRKEGAGFKEHVNDVKAYLKGLKSCWLHSN